MDHNVELLYNIIAQIREHRDALIASGRKEQDIRAMLIAQHEAACRMLDVIQSELERENDEKIAKM